MNADYSRIADDVRIGENVRLFGFVNLYGCEIGDETRIGTFVEVQKGVVIGRRCKVQSHTFICEGVTLEDVSRYSYATVINYRPTVFLEEDIDVAVFMLAICYALYNEYKSIGEGELRIIPPKYNHQPRPDAVSFSCCWLHG